MVVAFHIGLRPAELRALRWSAVDLDAATISVERQMSTDTDQRPVEGKIKTAKAYRVLRVPAVVVNALRQHQARQIDEEALGVWPKEWAGLVFRTEAGTPLSKMNLSRLFTRVAKAANVEGKVTPYDARRTFTTLLIEHYGVPHHRVVDMLGHEDLRMIEAHYRKSTVPVVDVSSVYGDS